ncbi:lantibiotic dehydratase, partial [Vagococcus fessus]
KNINKIKSKSYLQVDCEIKTNASILIKEDIQELENFVSFLLKISKNKRNKYLEEFKLRFVEKYGEYIEIPIYEVLDETLGIGAPMNYMNPKNRYISSLENHVPADDLTDYFMKKYIEAIKMNTSISLSLKEITLYLNVNNEEQNDEILTKNLELNFLIKTVKKNKKFYLGTNIGSIKAGKSFGRFSYFSDSFLGFMKECDSQFKNISTEDVCELVYFPKDVRSGNVTRNSSSNIKNISLYTNSYDEKNEIKISSVLVGVEDNKLYLRNLADNKKIVVTSNNMLNPTISDNGIRLLQEISLQDELSWSNFAWSEIYAQFSYVPQIEFENIIIDTELWKINKYSLELTDTKVSIEKFESHFIKLQKKLQIPNIFYLQSADNRILIDFTNRVYIDLMYKKYKQFGEMILRGIEVGGNLNTIYSGKRPVEIVVPFFKTSKSEVKITKEIKINKSIHQDNKFNPFD